MPQLSSFNILPSIFPPPQAASAIKGAWGGGWPVIRKQLIEGINLGGCWTGDQTDTLYNPHVSWLSLLFGSLVMIDPPHPHYTRFHKSGK
ncbi:hypothetical protein CEXT_35951 [Caerostris extrusa]|uniref:Uncharacterized protein n=1 Tax=Caerostris extrusa TaxID=172846 RepID=A0AAV4MIK3_CAEEX|nr:hypothetical protein CEXT_35951 [Caerostris extrusa]